MALPLYERAFRHAVIKGTPNNGPLWVKKDYRLNTEREPQICWNAFRDGLCHTGSFFEESEKAKSERWILPHIGLDAAYPPFPELTKDNVGNEVIIVNPWKLVSHILQKYEGNIELLEYAPAPFLPLRYIIETQRKL